METNNLQEQAPVMDLPEEKKPYPFVLQEHIRGKSAHLDIRFAVNNHLIGFTLDDPGRVGDPLRFSNNAEKSSENKVLAQPKARQPREWLKVNGEIEPGDIGATKDLPARFKILDKGMYEMGAQKTNFLEVYLLGNTYKGRFIFRKLQRPSDTDKAGKKPFVWFVWKPVKQGPYVLSSRAILQKWVPPKGRSALPREWENKIPSELRWWEKNWEGDKAIATIKSIRQIFLKRNILFKEKLDSQNTHKPSGKLKDIELTDQQKADIAILSKKDFSLSGIARWVGCSKGTVVYQQRKIGLR